MKEIEKILEMAKDSAAFTGYDLFNTAIISNLEECAKYLREKEEKEKMLGELQQQSLAIQQQSQERQRFNKPFGMVAEPEFSHTMLSLNSIIEYTESLKNDADVKTIKIMLYKLLLRKCSIEELERIGNIEPSSDKQTNYIFRDNSQNIERLDKQNNHHHNHGRR